MADTPLDNSGGQLKLSRTAGLGVEMNMDHLLANMLHGFGKARP